MSDLISRQAAIDALHTRFRDGFDKDRWWNSTHVLAAIEGLPSAQQRWIPVTERLPEPPSFCLVTTDGSHNDVIDIALYMSDGWHKASKVLAWMPLPEPYTEEKDE